METTTLTLEKLPQAFLQLYSKVENIERLILEKNSPPEPVPDQLLTIREAAAYLNLSVYTLYGYVHRATIPVCKRPGTKRLYFSKDELEKWVKAGRKKTVTEVGLEADQYINGKNKKG